MQKTILIFGAGINQLELIREAKKIGVTSVVIDPSNEPPGKVEADFFYQVQGNDYKKTKQIAIKHNVDGIVTGQMEKPMRLMAKLAKEFGYIFHDPTVVEVSLNKVLMKTTFLQHNVPCAKGVIFTKDEKISEDKISGFSFPLIIKPADAFSSRGVKKVFSLEELLKYEEESRSFSSESIIIVEEFLEGREFSVESITFQGTTTVIQVTEKFITPYPNTVEMAHFQPARITPEERKEIEDLVKKAIRAVEIDNSASHAEVMLTKSGAKMIEIGARLGGDFISSYLTKSSTGVSMDKAAVEVALGIKPDVKEMKNQFSLIKYLELPVGKEVEKIDLLDNLYKIPGLVFANILVKPGEFIQPITHSALRPACFIVENNSQEDIFTLADLVESELSNKIKLK